MAEEKDDVYSSSSMQARAMLKNFASVGAKEFEAILETAFVEQVRCRRRTLDRLCWELPDLLKGAGALRYNVMVRPLPRRTTLIRLDALGDRALKRVRPSAFLVLEGGPGEYQVWMAIRPGRGAVETANRLSGGAGAKGAAQKASPIAGSINFTEKYAPDFPRVRIIHTSPGCFVGTIPPEVIREPSP
jgi:hypothetical protein